MRASRINPAWLSAPYEYVYIFPSYYDRENGRHGYKLVYKSSGECFYAPRYATLEDAQNETNLIHPFEYFETSA